MFKVKKILAATSVALLMVGLSTKANQPEVKAAETFHVTINYVPNYSIAVWDNFQNGHPIPGKLLKHGTAWKVLKTTTVNNQTWYNLGGNQWIPANYTQKNDANTTTQTGAIENVSGTVRINVSGPVKSAPAKNAPTVGQVYAGHGFKAFKKAANKDGWWYNLGGNQWVSASFAAPSVFRSNAYSLLGVPMVDQYAEGEPYGCEAASGLQALKYYGLQRWTSLNQFTKSEPVAKDNNPHHGFAGSKVYTVNGVYQTIFPDAYTPWMKKFKSDVTTINGSSLNQIKSYVRQGRPVVAWVSIRMEAPRNFRNYAWGKGYDNLHVMTVDGFDANRVHMMDPVLGGYWVSNQTFLTAYNYFKYAVVI